MANKPQAPAIGSIQLYTKHQSATGKVFDLKGQLIQFEIFEGLNQPSYQQQMNLNILDPDNLLYPEITGQEVILIGFKSVYNQEAENYIKVFATIEAQKFLDSEQRQCVTIHCTTPYNIIGKLVYFSKVFDNISSQECFEQVTSVIERGFTGFKVDQKYQKNFENSLFPRPLNVPQRNWEWIIDYWVKNSVTQGNVQNSQLFYFWDDKNGLNFKQNRQLLKEDPKHVLYLMKNSFKPVTSTNIIDRFEVIQQVNVKNQIYNKTAQPFVVDLSTSEFALGSSIATDKIEDNIKQSKQDFDNTLIGQQNNRVFVPVNYATEWKLMGSQVTDQNVKTNVTNQIYEDTNYTTYALAEVTGDVMRCPGDLVQLVRIDRNGNVDKGDSSLWMIKQIKHTVTYDRYVQTLELMK